MRLSVPTIDHRTVDACRRLDALEVLICDEPDPRIRALYVRRFHEIWERMTGNDM